MAGPARREMRSGQSQGRTATAAVDPAARTKAGTPEGAPENVSDDARAIVTAGLAKDVDAVNR